jgi:hypothetical protein
MEPSSSAMPGISYKHVKAHLRALRQGLRAYDNWSVFLLLWAIIFGIIVRLLPVLRGEFPINDGGLFYTMTQELQNSGYRLPWFTAYNSSQIPFAYPPLSFYLMAFTANVSHIPLLTLFRWLPPLVSILSIPIFYWLSKLLLNSDIQAALATVAFAMLPRSYKWLIMGGGLPRALGLIFSMLAFFCLIKMFTSDKKRWIILTTVFSALLCLTHPEWTLHTIFIMGIIWLVMARNKTTTFKLILIAVGVLLLTMPWWGTVISRHGISPFWSAMNTGGYNRFFWGPLLLFNFSEEPYTGIISVLAIFGVLVCIYRQRWLFPLWLCVPFLVEFRNAATVVTVPLAILASIGFYEVLTPGLQWIQRGKQPDSFTNLPDWNQSLNQSKLLKLTLSFFLIYTLVNALVYSHLMSPIKLSEEDRRAFQWVKENTPTDSRFILVSNGFFFEMPLHEWFPSLTQRVNVSVVQGYEWVDGNKYFNRLYYFNQLTKCAWETVECVDNWAESVGTEYEYVWVHQHSYEDSNTAEEGLGEFLAYSMENSKEYSLVYASPKIKIFEHTDPTIKLDSPPVSHFIP